MAQKSWDLTLITSGPCVRQLSADESNPEAADSLSCSSMLEQMFLP